LPRFAQKQRVMLLSNTNGISTRSRGVHATVFSSVTGAAVSRIRENGSGFIPLSLTVSQIERAN
jgi:hypothetical protein